MVPLELTEQLAKSPVKHRFQVTKRMSRTQPRWCSANSAGCRSSFVRHPSIQLCLDRPRTGNQLAERADQLRLAALLADRAKPYQQAFGHSDSERRKRHTELPTTRLLRRLF